MATRTISTSIKLDGEEEFKKQMSSVNSELRTLKTEMAYTEEAFKGQANTMEALTKKDELLRREIEQQEEKIRALKKAVEESAEAFGDSDQRTDKYRQSLNRAQTDMLKLNRELSDNSKYLDEARNSADQTASSIDEYGQAVDSGKEKTSIFGEVLKANLASTSIIAGTKKLAEGLKEIPAEVLERSAEALKTMITDIKDASVAAAAYADDILTTSTVTGLSTDALQEYQYMAELTDVSVDTITGSLTKLTKNMETAKGGTGSAAEAFEALGISVIDAEGQLRSNQEVFGEVIDKLGEMDNETQRDAYSMEIFGKSAQDLNPLIAQGADGIAAFAEEAHNVGYVLDGETLASLGAVDDAVQRFEKALEAAKNQAGAEFAPAMESIFTGITELINGNVDQGMASIEKGLEQFGEKLEELGPYAEEALTVFLATFAEHLPELGETGVRLLLTLIAGIAKTAPELIPAAVDTITTIIDALWDNRGMVVEAGKDLIRGLWEGIENMGAWIGEKIRGFGSGVVNQLKDFFGISSESGPAGGSRIDGSNAGGLSYVPFDGYISELHRGEAVLTAQENRVWQQFKAGGYQQQPGVTAAELQAMLVGTVNALNSQRGGTEYVGTTVIQIDGQAFARATQPYFRAEDKSNPEVVSDT